MPCQEVFLSRGQFYSWTAVVGVVAVGRTRNECRRLRTRPPARRQLTSSRSSLLVSPHLGNMQMPRFAQLAGLVIIHLILFSERARALPQGPGPGQWSTKPVQSQTVKILITQVKDFFSLHGRWMDGVMDGWIDRE